MKEYLKRFLPSLIFCFSIVVFLCFQFTVEMQDFAHVLNSLPSWFVTAFILIILFWLEFFNFISGFISAVLDSFWNKA